MGYTHYWEIKEDIPQKDWDKLRKVTKAIIDESTVDVAYEEDEPKEGPAITGSIIRFNGIKDEGHETFYLQRTKEQFGFCKTVHNPYDEIVVAILIAASQVIDQKYFSWSSDGDEQDHEPGAALLRRVA